MMHLIHVRRFTVAAATLALLLSALLLVSNAQQGRPAVAIETTISEAWSQARAVQRPASG